MWYNGSKYGGSLMSENERIIANTNATMSMEDMPLMEEDRTRIQECLEGKMSFQLAVEMIIQKYINKQVV